MTGDAPKYSIIEATHAVSANSLRFHSAVAGIFGTFSLYRHQAWTGLAGGKDITIDIRCMSHQACPKCHMSKILDSSFRESESLKVKRIIFYVSCSPLSKASERIGTCTTAAHCKSLAKNG